MSQLRLAVFDVDGTLVDSQHNIVTAMTEAWARIGLGVPQPEAVRRVIGLSLLEACAVMLPQTDSTTHRSVAEAFKESFRTLRLRPEAAEPMFPGARTALDELEAAGWLLGLATGKSRRGVESMIEEHDLAGRFVTIQTADENPGKPDPTMLLRAADEAGADLAQVVMIGDTTFDMRMANAARAAALGVSWGYHSLDDLRRAGAHMVIDSFDNLGDTLAAVTRNPTCG